MMPRITRNPLERKFYDTCATAEDSSILISHGKGELQFGAEPGVSQFLTQPY